MVSQISLRIPSQFRILLGIGVCILVIVISVLLFFLVPMLPPFYDADYNAVRTRLEHFPDVQIVNSWRHEDMSLEDFGFTLQKSSCPPVTLNFYEVHNSRWLTNFQSIDGVVLVQKGQNGSPNTITRLSREQLEHLNLPTHSIEDVFTHLSPLLEQLNKQPRHIQEGVAGADSSFAYLSYQGGVCTSK